MTWTSGFYKAWWGTTSPSWEVSQVSPSKSIKVTGASWKWKWNWKMMENMWHKKDENLYSLSCKLRDKNQDSSSAWKSAIHSVNNRFEGFSMLFLYGPGIGRIDVIFGMIKMPSSLLMFRFLQIPFSQIDVFFSKGWQNWCHFVTSAVAFRSATKALWFDQSLLVAWRALCAAGCGGFPTEKNPGLYIYIHTAYRCCSLDPLKYFWYTVAVWVTCMSDIRACNEAAFWKIPIAAVRWLSAWPLPSSIHLASQTTTGTRAITLGNMFHFDIFFPQIAENTICRRKTLWCDVPKMLQLAPNCCLSLHTACHGNFCLHLY